MKILNFITNSWNHLDSLARDNVLCVILDIFSTIAHVVLSVSLFVYFVIWALPELYMYRALLAITFIASIPYLIYYLYLRNKDEIINF